MAFAPHRPGLPIVVDELGHRLLNAFDTSPTRMDDVVRRLSWTVGPETSEAALRLLVAAFHYRGFLTTEPEPARHTATAFAGSGPARLGVWLHLSGRCNLACSYCFVEKSGRAMSVDALSRGVKAIATTAAARGVEEVEVRMAGGEPTLELPPMEKAHALLKSRLGEAGIRLRTAVVTNGTCASERFLDFLRRSGVEVYVSVDGVGPAQDLHRRFAATGEGSWNLVSSVIERLKAEGVPVSLAATLSEETCASFPQLVEWAVERGLPITVQHVSMKRGSGHEAPPSHGDFAAYGRLLAASVVEGIRVLELLLESGRACPALTISRLNLDEPSFGWCCGIGTCYVTLTEDGSVAACPRIACRQTAPLASDLVAVVESLFPHSPADRNSHEDDECLACQWFPVCGGGCPVTNLLVHGDPSSRSPLCQFRRAVIPPYVEFLGRKLLGEARRDFAR